MTLNDDVNASVQDLRRGVWLFVRTWGIMWFVLTFLSVGIFGPAAARHLHIIGLPALFATMYWLGRANAPDPQAEAEFRRNGAAPVYGDSDYMATYNNQPTHGRYGDHASNPGRYGPPQRQTSYTSSRYGTGPARGSSPYPSPRPGAYNRPGAVRGSPIPPTRYGGGAGTTTRTNTGAYGATSRFARSPPIRGGAIGRTYDSPPPTRYGAGRGGVTNSPAPVRGGAVGYGTGTCAARRGPGGPGIGHDPYLEPRNNRDILTNMLKSVFFPDRTHRSEIFEITQAMDKIETEEQYAERHPRDPPMLPPHYLAWVHEDQVNLRGVYRYRGNGELIRIWGFGDERLTIRDITAHIGPNGASSRQYKFYGPTKTLQEVYPAGKGVFDPLADAFIMPKTAPGTRPPLAAHSTNTAYGAPKPSAYGGGSRPYSSVYDRSRTNTGSAALTRQQRMQQESHRMAEEEEGTRSGRGGMAFEIKF